MRPMKLRSHLLLLTMGTVLPLVVVAAAAGWIFATDAPVNDQEMAWLIVLGVFGTLCFAALLPLALAERIAQPLGALADMAKAVASGAPAEPLAEPRVREIGEVADVIAATGQTVRLREKSLRDADRAKDEFVAMLSHELRNPLGALSAAAQV